MKRKRRRALFPNNKTGPTDESGSVNPSSTASVDSKVDDQVNTRAGSIGNVGSTGTNSSAVPETDDNSSLPWDPEDYYSDSRVKTTVNGRNFLHKYLLTYADESSLEYFSSLSSFTSSFDQEDLECVEEIEALQAEIVNTVLENITEILTEHQYECFYFYFVQSMSQSDIAKYLGITQSAVSKALYGQYVKYRNTHKSVGGAIYRIQRWIKNNGETSEKLKEINRIGTSMPFYQRQYKSFAGRRG